MATIEDNSSPWAPTVVIVGPGSVEVEVVAQLKQRGVRLESLPSVKTMELDRFERLDEALDHLYGYDWVFFANVSAVEYFLRRLPEKGLDSNSLDELKVLALGDQVEELLRDARVHVDVVPSTSKSKEVLTAIEQFVGDSEALGQQNFLAPRGTTVHDALTRRLVDLGARVDLVPAYQIELTNGEDLGRTAALLAGDADCVVLTGPDSVSQLAKLFDSGDLESVLPQASVVCFDGLTAEAAAASGLKANILASQAAILEFAEGLR